MGKIFKQLTSEQLQQRRLRKQEIQNLCILLLRHLQNRQELSQEELQHFQENLISDEYADLDDHYNDLIVYGFRMAFSEVRKLTSVFLDNLWSQNEVLELPLLSRLTEGGYISDELSTVLLKHIDKIPQNLRHYLSNKLQGLLISGIKIDPYNDDKIEEMEEEDCQKLRKLIQELGHPLY